MPRFTHNIQFAGYPFTTCDEKGMITFEAFSKLFLRFPWGAQMRLRETMEDGCSATLSVVETHTNSILWVSVQGDDREPTYIVEGICYEPHPADSKRLLCCSVRKMTDAEQDVLAVAKLFFVFRWKQMFHYMSRLPDWKTLAQLEATEQKSAARR